MKNYTNYLKSITNQFLGFFGRKLKIISTFNGIGAATEALKQLGIDFDMHTVCEIEKNANNTYYKNNEKTNHIDDIRELEKNIEKNLKLDILIQTPPCQSFSMAGLRKGLESLNGNLFLTAINLQKKVDANVVVYENVKGLVSNHKTHYIYKNANGETVEFSSKPKKETIKNDGLELVKTIDLSKPSLINKDYDGKKKSIGNTLHTIEKLLLEDTRYNYYWKVINSADQGLPQNRERIFIVAIKKELDKGFTFPENKDLAFEISDILESKPANNVYYKNEAGHKLNPTNQKIRKNRVHTIAKYDETMTYESTRRVYSPYVSPCITTGNNAKYMIEDKVRVLTPTENQRIHGFSEEFEFVGSTTQQNKQLGNTVSPGVYVNLFASIFNSVEFEKSANNVEYKPTKRRGRPLKKTIVKNNHINIVKKIANQADLNYLNIIEKRFNEYKSHLENGGTMSMTVEFSENMKMKKKGKFKEYVVVIEDLQKLGFRDKKNGIYRVKITGKRLEKEKVGKKEVLNSRNGGKNQFEEQTNYGVEQLNTQNHKTVVDGFCGAGGFTLKNIENMKFDSYVMNEWDFYQHTVFLGVKKNPSKVIEVFEKYNNEYLSLINEEHLEIEKLYVKNKCTSKSPEYYERKELRLKNIQLKKYYEKTIHLLEDKTQDIYTLAGLYIFVMNRTFNGIFEYKNEEQTIIDETSFNWHLNPKDKVKMIKHWSYILNKYNVELTNEDIFEVIKRLDSDSTLYLDPPYFESGEGADYGCNWSNKDQLKLLDETSRFQRVLYSNENCSELFDLGIDKYFNDYITFKRQNKLGRVDKCVGGEFLGFRNSSIYKQNTMTNTPINNRNYHSSKDLEELVS
jgi:DNA (cytosine-5)-methyltransferase 1